jgi:hypothetical protein
MRCAKTVAVLCLFIVSVSYLRAQTDPTQGQSLGDIARALRLQKKGALAVPNQPTQGASAGPTGESLGDAARRLREKRRESQQPGVTDEVERTYKINMRQLLKQENFAALDEAAEQARKTKGRLPGGVWNLLVFYEAVDAPPTGTKASDAEWQAHIALLKRWIEQKPQSVTARVALGDAYLHYAWKARGDGYAKTVSESGWKTMKERMELSAATLMEASKLPTKCPYWYEVMQSLLRSAGIEKPKMHELFEAAIAFEPTYNDFYREQATYLLPKWAGEPGEAEAFAEETYKRVGGKEGAFLYFEIASTIYCDCANEPQPLKLSWKRIQEGYAYMSATYGTSNLKRNRMASLALQAHDRAVAHEMFAHIGNAWDPDTWRSKARFEQVKTWAQ